MASYIDNMALKVIEIIMQEPAFDLSQFAQALASYIYNDGYLKPLRPVMGSEDYPPNGASIFGKALHNKNKVELTQYLGNLSASTFALACHRTQDKYGFSESVKLAEAEAMAKDSLIKLVPHLIEAHIDAMLSKNAIASLREMVDGDSGIIEAYKRLLGNTNVQATVAAAKTSPYGKTFRGALIFVYEYFRQKGTPYIRGQVPASGAADGSFTDVVKAWLQNNQAPTEGGLSFAEVFNRISDHMNDPNSVLKDVPGFSEDLLRTILPVELLCFPGLDIEADLPYIAKSLLEELTNIGADTKLGELVLSAIPKEIMSFGAEFWVEWDKHVEKTTQFVQLSLNKAEEVEGKGMQSEGLSPGRKMAHWVDIVNGVAAADTQRGLRDFDVWQKLNYGGWVWLPCDEQWEWGVNRRVQRKPGSFYFENNGCFRAGTLVWTDRGQQPIETLRENDRVLTRAEPRQYGVRSDERVILPVDSAVRLYGFNDEQPFFTSNHVFFTTTGLRAVDPQGAIRENPWLQVGRLQPGHVLLKTDDGESYEQVPIHSLTQEVGDCTEVYGVHLREGLRSYHANGYLVHLNYPEITIKSIADRLRTFRTSEQMEMLKHIKELQPLFDRFGQATMSQVLARELSLGEDHLALMQATIPIPDRPLPLFFQSRSFDLSCASSEDVLGDRPLPTVDVYDGVLCVDGEVCSRARVTERGFMWSRELDPGTSLWEHGMCTFGQDVSLLAGAGAVWREVSPDGVPTSASKPIMIQVRTATLRAFQEAQGIGAAAETDGVVAAAMEVVEPEFENVESKVESVDEFGDWGVESKMASVVDSQDGDAISELINMVEPGKRQEELEKQADDMLGERPRKVPRENLDTTVLQTFNIGHQPWQTEEDPDQRPAIPLGQIQLITKAEKNGPGLSSVAFPDLDAITRFHWEKQRQAESSLEPQDLYQVTTVSDRNGNHTVDLLILNPERLALLADDNAAEGPEGNRPRTLEDLTFKNSNSEWTLKFIFAKLTFTIDTLHGKIEGRIIRFNPEFAGDEGEQHALFGDAVQRPNPSLPLPALNIPQGAKTSPFDAAGWFQKLKLPTQLTLHDLVVNIGVDPAKLKEDTQLLLRRTMLFHMSNDDRSILGYTNPPPVSDSDLGALPVSLVADLDGETKRWLRDTYAPAYILQSFMNSALSEKQLRDNFNIGATPEEKKRLRYFWTGSGKSCLSRSPIFHRLNKTLSKVAALRRYPKIREYLGDTKPVEVEGPDAISQVPERKGLIGGEKWAHLLYDALTTEHWVSHIAEQCKFADITDLNPLDTYTTIINLLWDGQDEDPGDEDDRHRRNLPKRLATIVETYLKMNQYFKHRWVEDPENILKETESYMEALMFVVLDPQHALAAGISPGFLVQVDKELEELKIKTPEFEKKTREEQARAVAHNWSGWVKKSLAVLTAGKAASNIVKTSRGIYDVLRSWYGYGKWPFGDMKWASTPLALKWYGGISALGALGVTLYYLWETRRQWGELADDDVSAVNKIHFVTTGVQAIGNNVLSGIRWVDVWKNPVSAAAKEAKMAEDAAKLHAEFLKKGGDVVTRSRSRVAVYSAVTSQSGRTVYKNVIAERMTGLKPTGLRARFEQWKTNARVKATDWWDRSKAYRKAKFSTTEVAFKVFAVAISIVLVCIQAYLLDQLIRDPDSALLDIVLGAFHLFVQCFTLVLDVVAFFCAVPVVISIVTVVFGLVVGWVIDKILGEPKPPKQAIEVWWEKKGSPLLKRMPDPPETRFVYEVDPTQAPSGSDTTIAIRVSQREQHKAPGLLSKVFVRFTSSADDKAALFQTGEAFECVDGKTELLRERCRMALPDRLSSQVLVDVSEQEAKGMRTWDLGFGIKSREELNLKEDDPLPDITMGPQEELKFEVRSNRDLLGR
ncbi:hypothetical protein ACJ41O_013616 [Fusarium nematophilum]